MTARTPQTQSIRDRFVDAMAMFPSGITIVTTADPDDGRWLGFTATSFCSVSLDPPLVLVCLGRTAYCHDSFARADRFRIHVLRSDHADLALNFATQGAEKFALGAFSKDEHGFPVLPTAIATVDCRPYAQYEGGDHSILVGEVEDVSVADASPVIYFRRSFHDLVARPEVSRG
jgi:flavin reductase ActVB